MLAHALAFCPLKASVSYKLKIKGDAAAGPRQLTFTASDHQGRARTVTITLIVE